MRKLLLESLIRRRSPSRRRCRTKPLAELAGSVGHAARRRLGRSLSIREVDAGSCNGCELEIHALNNAYYDLERFGIRFVASPRHADVLLVTGPVTKNMREALKRTYNATPDPKRVVAVGDCARDGGVFAGGVRRRRLASRARRSPHPRLPAYANGQCRACWRCLNASTRARPRREGFLMVQRDRRSVQRVLRSGAREEDGLRLPDGLRACDMLPEPDAAAAGYTRNGRIDQFNSSALERGDRLRRESTLARITPLARLHALMVGTERSARSAVCR